MCATKLCNLFMKFYHLHVAFTGSPYRILSSCVENHTVAALLNRDTFAPYVWVIDLRL